MSVVQQECRRVMLALAVIFMSGCSVMPEAAYDHEAKMVWVGLEVKL